LIVSTRINEEDDFVKRGLSYVQTLDLDYLAKRLVEKEAWVEEEAKEAVRRYKNFLILACKYPETPLAPTPDIDEVWHNHILYTRKYMHDCDAIFGKYLHHEPFSGTESSEIEEMSHIYYEVCALYRREFEESYPRVLDVTAFW
jgi:hypothetical protein